MTAKRFRVNELVKYNYSEIGEYIDENHTDRPLRNDILVELLNELHEENEQLRHDATILVQANQDYRKENEQLKQDNNALIHLLENQSIIIQELHSKLLEYQVKEPIVLTKEDLELMGKALSYYTHGKCGE